MSIFDFEGGMEFMNKERVGFIGLGNMGARMTRRLVDAGIAVLGYDTVRERIDTAGAKAAETVSEVIAYADVVMMSLPDSKVVEAVVEGEDGVLAHCREGQIVVDLSTAAASSTIRLAKRFTERGARYVDAGISGGAAAAAKGSLTLMVGGDADAVAALQWAFAPISSKVAYMGESGAGHTTKLLNNFLNAVSLAASAEVMVAGKKAGLDLHLLLDVLNSSSGVNFATLNRFPKIVDGDYLEGGLTGKLMTKDVVLYVDRARELGVISLNSAGPLASFGLGTALGYGDVISNRVVDAIGDVSGGVRLFDGVHKEKNA
jgi:3-hydroxyisobutyrate dehydrogenase